MDSTQRFSSRVDDYVKYRPSYPSAIVDDLFSDRILHSGATVADIGSGTGLLAKIFLDRNVTVIGIEPNAEMRAAGDQFLSSYPHFTSRPGRAEETGLPAESVDLITAGQAFHWFDPPAAKIEFRRILRDRAAPSGHVALIWNERKVDTSPFLQGYEAMMKRVSADYEKVDHRRVTDDTMRAFFAPGTMTLRTYPNAQAFDLTGLRGRVLSSSYAPQAGQPHHEAMMQTLDDLFARHQNNGAVLFEYETKVYTGKA